MKRNRKRRKKVLLQKCAVKLSELRPGPIRHSELDPFLTAWARALYARVGKFMQPTFEQWELQFLRDLHPHRELFVWEGIAKTFEEFFREHPEGDKRVTLGTLCLISMEASPTDGSPTPNHFEDLKKRWLRIWQGMVQDIPATVAEVERSLAEDSTSPD